MNEFSDLLENLSLRLERSSNVDDLVSRVLSQATSDIICLHAPPKEKVIICRPNVPGTRVNEKVKPMQRSGTEAIRPQIQPSKPKRE